MKKRSLTGHAHFRDLIVKAIAIEDKMAQFYGRMATQATSPETREVLLILAREEEEHRALLEKYLRLGVLPRHDILGTFNLEPVTKVVASITADISSVDALAFAIRSEEYQHRFYQKLSLAYPPGEIQDFLQKMAEVELAHKEKVERLQRWFLRFQGQLT